MPFHPVAAYLVVARLRGQAFPLQFGINRPHRVERHLAGCSDIRKRSASQDAVERKGLCRAEGCSGFFRHDSLIKPALAHIAIVYLSDAVELCVHGVDRSLDFPHALGLRHIAQHIFVHHGEVAVEINQEALVGKRFPVKRHVGRLHHRHALRLQVFKLLAVPEVEAQMELVGRHLESAGVGQNDLCAVKTLVGLIDDGLVKHAGLCILPLHIEVEVGDFVVKHSLRNLHGRLRLLHAEQKGSQTDLGIGRRLVLEIERHARKHDDQHQDGTHDAHKRNARGLHGKQLQLLSHVAKRDERSQQNGKRQRHGNQRDTHVPEELPQNIQRQSLAYQFVDVTPRELHHENEQANEEGAEEQRQKLL